MKFYKYHGAGNDFILLDNFKGQIKEKNKHGLAKKLCHRRFGVGGDGLLLVEKSHVADVKMRIFNPDGSEAEMCGNGIRCIAKYVYDYIARKKYIKIETIAGVKGVEIKNNHLKVNMGKPEFDRAKIPAKGLGKLLNEDIPAAGEIFKVSALNLGVPHAVIFVEDIEKTDVVRIGSILRYNEVFPLGVNVNFVQRVGSNKFKIRTYERGVEGETFACGTGISASAAVAGALGLANTAKPIKMEARGGTLFVEIKEINNKIEGVYLKGSVEFVFSGDIT